MKVLKGIGFAILIIIFIITIPMLSILTTKTEIETDNEREVIQMTVDPMTVVKCPTCGSTAQVREDDIEQFEEGIIFSYSCGCGCKFTERYVKSDTCIYVQGKK